MVCLHLVRMVDRDALRCHSDSDMGLAELHVARLTVAITEQLDLGVLYSTV